MNITRSMLCRIILFPLACLLAVTIGASVPGSAGAIEKARQEQQFAGGPSIFIPAHHFEFEPVLEGALVVHDFRIANHGDAPLLINEVRTS